MSRFPRDEHYVQCCGSLTDLVARAIYEDPVVVDSLQGRFSLDIQYRHGSEITNVSLDLRHRLLVA